MTVTEKAGADFILTNLTKFAKIVKSLTFTQFDEISSNLPTLLMRAYLNKSMYSGSISLCISRKLPVELFEYLLKRYTETEDKMKEGT